jgi:hypothetical protein
MAMAANSDLIFRVLSMVFSLVREAIASMTEL